MKLFNNKQLLLRVIAAAADSILFYISYLVLSRVFGSIRINIVFFIIAALAGLLANFLPYNNDNKRKSTLIFGSIGLAWAIIVIIITSLIDLNIMAIPMILILFIYLYYRSYLSYLSNILYVYTIRDFYRNVGLLFLLNIAITVFSGILGEIAAEVMRFSILYTIIALYMMTQVKNFRYINKNENRRKTAFEAVVTAIMIGSTVIMSIPEVFKIVTYPFVVFFHFIYLWIAKGLLYISYPIARLFGYLFGLVDTADQMGNSNKIMDKIGDSTEKYRLKDYATDSQFIQMLGKALAFMLLLAICAYAIYLLFRFINRITRSEIEEDFTEDKEFVLGNNKDKGPGLLSKLGDSLKKAAGNISFLLRANNAEKLRNEYKVFIQKLRSKKMIEHYNYTAQNIYQLMLERTPDQQEALDNVTSMYEEVRYGVKYPEDMELKTFRKNLAEISKAIQQLE